MSTVYSVSQVNAYIKDLLQRDYALGRLQVRGEVSNLKYHSSGHIYFTLKDGGGQMACVMFASARAGLGFRMKDGDKVVVCGSIGVYEAAGRYQLYAREILPDGTGSLYLAFERLKKELGERGLFDPAHKKEIPGYCARIGIVTASTGAAIQDIRQIAARRNPYAQLILCPARVQGEGAAASVARGIRRLDAMGLDVIIVGRGGGSIEDLWAFNEEETALAIYNCRTPIISAVGHETDTTIADFVADLRAPTPSAAAELAVCNVFEIFRKLDQIQKRLEYASPASRLQQLRQRLMDREDLLERGLKDKLMRARHRLQIGAGRLEGLSPLKKLAGGYAFVADENGRGVRDGESLAAGERVTLTFAAAKAKALIESVEKGGFHGEGNDIG